MVSSLRVWFTTFSVLVGLVACGSGEGGQGGGPADTAVESAALTESPSALVRIEDIRERFQIVGDTETRPVIGEGVATFERDVPSGGLRAAFDPGDQLGVTRAATVVLPERASGAVELRADLSDVAVTFALRGAGDASAEIASGTILYRGAFGGSDLVHRVTADGTEDFVVFDDRPEREELVYDVDVSRAAGLRLVSNTLELVDNDGAPQLRIAPPYVVDAAGKRTAARLSVEGCAVDADPRAPWGRAPVAPGNAHCDVRVAWEGVAYPAVVDPTWTTTGSMAEARYLHTATMLGTGKVLLAGGYKGISMYLASAELYDPSSGTFAATGSMATLRYRHTATKLGTGKVLVAGGSENGNFLTGAELYDPGAGTFSGTGPMATARAGHTATLLPSGSVLVAAGSISGGSTPTAEIYEPGAGTFAATGPMAQGRISYSATLVGTGKVLVAGGQFGSAILKSAQLYDPAAGTFTTTGTMAFARRNHTATLLGSGKVLVAAGSISPAYLFSAELYDPTAGTWATTGPLAAARAGHTATLLGSGKVLVAGGGDGGTILSSAELYDPTVGTFAATGSMVTGRQWHTATLLGSGKVLAAGGENSGYLASAELFDLLATGTACAIDGECSTGACADGVCCNVACTGICDACTAAKKGSGSDGTCGPVAVGSDPNNDCATDPATSCLKVGTCDGASACTLYSAGTVCAPATCAAGTQTSSACDGDGTCEAANVTCAPYTCAATQCETSCSTNAQCASSAYCDVNVCKPKKPNGDACTAGTQCVIGNCVDQVCCDTACVGLCQACSAAKKGSGVDGECEPVDAGLDLDGECADDGSGSCDRDGTCNGAGACRLYQQGVSCGATTCAINVVTGLICDGLGTCANEPGGVDCFPYTCAVGACAIPCGSDAQCQTGYWCDQGTCALKGSPGVSCVGGNECASPFCVDGVCCETACGGLCQACSAAKKGSGADGDCEPIDTGNDPDGDCPDDGSGSCDRDGMCDGAGACRQYVLGTECQASECQNNVVTNHACNGLGTCQSSAGTDCQQFLCVAGACNTGCSSAADCASTAYCDENGLCVAKAAQGDPCAAGNTCLSTLCVDGFCCNAPCLGQCEACDVAGGEGACVPVSGLPHGARPTCDPGTPDDPCLEASCDGAARTSCAGFVGSGVTCLEASCADGIAVFAETCDGEGSCPAPMTKSCEPFVCAGVSCGESCASDGDCAQDFACDLPTQKCVSGATCDGEHTVTEPNEPPKDCTPYRCEGSSCRDTCTSVDDCVESYVCDPEGHCIALDEQSDDGGEEGGCGCRVVRSTEDDGRWLFGAFLGLAALGRRRLRARAIVSKHTGTGR